MSASENAKPIVIVISLDGLPARALQDPKLPMPTLRSLAAAGAVADAMQPINPTMTWPNHTTLITGVDASHHHVMANGLIAFPPDGSAPEVKPWVDKDKLVHARTLYEAAGEQGMTTAQVDWVAIYGAKNVDWEFGEKPDPDGVIAREMIAGGSATREQIETFGERSSPAWRDEMWTDAAIDILKNHTPNLLLLHLLQTDTIQHGNGPFSNPAYAAYAYADDCLKRVVDAARSKGILDRTTFFIVSDHGFATYTHTIFPNAALAQQGLLHRAGDHYAGAVWGNAEGGAAELYIRDEALRAKLVPQLKKYFAAVPGVAHVYTNAEARMLGLPAEPDTDQAPQLYLAAAPGYAFGDDAFGPLERVHEPRGQHGYLNTMSEMQALFVASGAAILPGVHLDTISNLKVAPTIAMILGVQLPAAEQPALKEILR
ncbi:sulfatase-like hydrolase/transferase [Granulicella sp. WH15]|uniref:alkaline phosphatase family protein n=1 Tax=Granulicella sp. WH15 TaxID=2602070 RepID=UPI0013675EC5|nr:alkaline phosphatase family protein [Granulicella sp. WH15]QHN02908.1 sulfatase-like hydrolase/transferase [Granulicella sp. WH15]